MVLALPYLGNIAFYATAYKAEELVLSPNEVYQKQTYRNRAQIQGANKVLDLSVPIVKPKGAHVKTKDIQVAYSDDWTNIHLRSIKSAYGKTPYFEHLYPFIESILQSKPSFLIDLNTRCHEELVDFMQLDLPIKESKDRPTTKILFKPSKRMSYSHETYFQAFSDRQEFQLNLSIIDFLFNEGPEVSGLFNSVKLNQ